MTYLAFYPWGPQGQEYRIAYNSLLYNEMQGLHYSESHMQQILCDLFHQQFLKTSPQSTIYLTFDPNQVHRPQQPISNNELYHIIHRMTQLHCHKAKIKAAKMATMRKLRKERKEQERRERERQEQEREHGEQERREQQQQEQQRQEQEQEEQELLLLQERELLLQEEREGVGYEAPEPEPKAQGQPLPPTQAQTQTQAQAQVQPQPKQATGQKKAARQKKAAKQKKERKRYERKVAAASKPTQAKHKRARQKRRGKGTLKQRRLAMLQQHGKITGPELFPAQKIFGKVRPRLNVETTVHQKNPDRAGVLRQILVKVGTEDTEHPQFFYHIKSVPNTKDDKVLQSEEFVEVVTEEQFFEDMKSHERWITKLWRGKQKKSSPSSGENDIYVTLTVPQENSKYPPSKLRVFLRVADKPVRDSFWEERGSDPIYQQEQQDFLRALAKVVIEYNHGLPEEERAIREGWKQWVQVKKKHYKYKEQEAFVSVLSVNASDDTLKIAVEAMWKEKYDCALAIVRDPKAFYKFLTQRKKGHGINHSPTKAKAICELSEGLVIRKYKELTGRDIPQEDINGDGPIPEKYLSKIEELAPKQSLMPPTFEVDFFRKFRQCGPKSLALIAESCYDQYPWPAVDVHDTRYAVDVGVAPLSMKGKEDGWELTNYLAKVYKSHARNKTARDRETRENYLWFNEMPAITAQLLTKRTHQRLKDQLQDVAKKHNMEDELNGFLYHYKYQVR